MYEIRLNTARNALRYLIKVYKIKEIYIPYYICPVIREAIIKEHTKIKFYHIDNNFFPTMKFNNDDFILYPNYFGICAKNVIALADKYKNLIIDNAHAFFMRHDLGLASFASLRKFFNVPSGSILYCQKTLSKNIACGIQVEKNNEAPKTEEEFLLNENYLNKSDIKFMSQNVSCFLDNLNLAKEKEKRLQKFNVLNEKLNNSNQLKITLSKEDIPFAYPYLIKDYNAQHIEIDEILSKYNVLRLWNNLPHDFLEYNFYKNLMIILL